MRRAKSEQFGLACEIYEGIKLFPFGDGICVALVEREFLCKDVVEFLWARRTRHLELLSVESSLLRTLQAACKDSAPNSAFRDPLEFTYVMSVHHIWNLDRTVTNEQICMMTEPSVLGISDDPLQQPILLNARDVQGPFENRRQLFARLVHSLEFERVNYYVSWANVMIESTHVHGDGIDLLLGHELRLQHLWYKLHLLLEELPGRFDASDTTIDPAEEWTVNACSEVKSDFRRLTSIRPTASTDSIALMSSLIETSRIKQLYSTFIEGYRQVERDEPASVLRIGGTR